jgi:hypothetical protein
VWKKEEENVINQQDYGSAGLFDLEKKFFFLLFFAYF